MADREQYIRALDRVHAPAELSERVMETDTDNKPAKARKPLRRALCAAAVIIALIAASNLVTLAATGEAWTMKLFWYDEKPSQPRDNVRQIFFDNKDKLPQTEGGAKSKYYGGTYLENGVQVILLTDLSCADSFENVGENIRFEKCDYSYAELSQAQREIGEKLDRMRRHGEGFAEDANATAIEDRENRLYIYIKDITDEKIQWFKENVSDAGYLVFEPGADAHEDC